MTRYSVKRIGVKNQPPAFSERLTGRLLHTVNLMLERKLIVSVLCCRWAKRTFSMLTGRSTPIRRLSEFGRNEIGVCRILNHG